jgi:hypothetical protein
MYWFAIEFARSPVIVSDFEAARLGHRFVFDNSDRHSLKYKLNSATPR